MPKMGDGMEEGTLLEWLKKDGEKVKMGEVIGTIQTDKATLELESPGSGAITGFLLEPGQTVPVGVPIAILLKDGEKVPANWGSGERTATAENPEAPQEVAHVAAGVSEAIQAQISMPSNARIKASPL
ncbi:MAG: biotin/lipoyl-containing protein, partial [Pirellula sp.]